jgi:kynurenine formamidase
MDRSLARFLRRDDLLGDAEPFKRTTVAEGKTPQGYYYSAYNYSAAEHGGTHIDAPVHFGEGKKSVDQLELSQLISPA